MSAGDKNPLLVIGTGGTGKWAVTYTKQILVDRANRALLREHGDEARHLPEWNRLPSTVRLLAFDVDSASDTVAADARSGGVTLSDQEFISFGAEYQTTLESLQSEAGTTDFPQIAAWLGEEDANCYDLHALSGAAIDGAGQMRQIGRLSLWLQLVAAKIPDVISKTCADLRQNVTETTKLTVMVVGSVAGGTGSGTFIDFAALARHYAQERFGLNQQVVGFMVLPTTFGTVISDGVEQSRMAANGYAAMRELLRLNAYPSGATLEYSDGMSVKLDKSLLTISYLVEGSRRGTGADLSNTKPHEGVNPAIAEVIALHADHFIDYSQIATGLMGRADAAYSALGTVTYIAAIEDMIHEFGTRLSRIGLERLTWGLAESESSRVKADAKAAAAVLANDALGGLLNQPNPTRPNIVAWVDQILGSARVQQLPTAAHMQYLRNLTEGELSPNLPPTELRGRIPVASFGSKGDPPRVKLGAEKLMQETRGGQNDRFTGKPGRGSSANAVAVLYAARTDVMFREHLAQHVGALLNDGPTTSAVARPGGIAAAMEFLDRTSQTLAEFRTKLSDAYREQQLVVGGGQRRTKLDIAIEAMGLAEEDMLRDEGARDRMNNKTQQEVYLDRCKEVLDLQIQDDVHSATVGAIDRCRETTEEVRKVVLGWQQTLDDDIAELREEHADIIRQRRNMARIVVRRYVTDPEDAVERKLWAEQTGANDDQDAALSPAAVELTANVRWTWEGKRLLLTGPFDVEGGDTVDWTDQARPAYELIAASRFSPMRPLTIWDLLNRKAVKANAITSDLLNRSGTLTAYDNQIQRKAPPVDVDAHLHAAGLWLQPTRDRADGGAAGLSQAVENALTGQRGTTKIEVGTDPHTLVVAQMAHYVKMSALSCRANLRKEYDRLATGAVTVENTTGKTPLHVMAGEREAVKLELNSDRLIQRAIELSPPMIGRLERREDLVLFGRVWLTGKITQKRTSAGEQFWVTKVRLDGDEAEREVRLGQTLIDVCDTFVAPRSQEEIEARESLFQASERAHTAAGTVAYGKKLSAASRKAILPKDSKTPLTQELDDVLRLLLRDRGDFLQGK